MAPTVTSFEGNSRLRRIRAAAALAGVELNYDPSFTFKSNWKTPEFLEKFPLGTQPTLEDGDFCLTESAAITEYGEWTSEASRRKYRLSLPSFPSLYVLNMGQRAPCNRPWTLGSSPSLMRLILSYPCLNDLCRELFRRVVSSYL